MTIEVFNKLSGPEAERLLFSCCGSQKWVAHLMKRFPFADAQSLVTNAEKIWYNECTETDWLEAFTHHPMIGDVESLGKKFQSTEHFAGKEQAGVATATWEMLQDLLIKNAEYKTKFGFIFIVSARGKSVLNMHRLITSRLNNLREEELNIAVGEQHKITVSRIKEVIDEDAWSILKISQLTTHVLDTSSGRPGADIMIKLKQHRNNQWQTFSQGLTNNDGRCLDFLPPGKTLSPGNYKLVFDTGNYFLQSGSQTFFPEVEIQFTVLDDNHYHVPLLISPFGYSTYRGS